MNSGMAIFKSETYPEFEIIDVVASKSSGEWGNFWGFPAPNQDQISQSRNFESFFGFISRTWSGLPRLSMLTRCREIPAKANHFAQSVLSPKNKSIFGEMPSRGWLESSHSVRRRLRSGVEAKESRFVLAVNILFWRDQERNSKKKN